MSNPTDLRVIKTRQAIRIALISLLSEKELSDITISESFPPGRRSTARRSTDAITARFPTL